MRTKTSRALRLILRNLQININEKYVTQIHVLTQHGYMVHRFDSNIIGRFSNGRERKVIGGDG